MTGPYIIFYRPAKLDTVHHRHHDVADDDTGNPLLRQCSAFTAVFCRQYFEIVAEGVAYVFTYVGVVFYHE